MWEKMKVWIHNIVTEPNNQTICIVRVMAVGTFLYAIGTHAYTIFYQHAAFDLSNFAMGWGGMITTLAAALRIKTDSPKEGE